MSELVANFVKNIVRYRKANNLNVPQFAEMLKMKKQAVYYWETGKNRPSLNNITLVAEKMGISESELVSPAPEGI